MHKNNDKDVSEIIEESTSYPLSYRLSSGKYLGFKYTDPKKERERKVLTKSQKQKKKRKRKLSRKSRKR